MIDDAAVVQFSVKELFARIDAKLDALASILDAKADHAAVVALEKRVNELESNDDKRSGASGAQKAIIALLFAIAGLLVPIVLAVAT